VSINSLDFTPAVATPLSIPSFTLSKKPGIPLLPELIVDPAASPERQHESLALLGRSPTERKALCSSHYYYKGTALGGQSAQGANLRGR
ncbi:MAG TPA: hypothetical protein VHS28_01415, partial [Chloroflexota bacterium]|nr:hypothetical protein [Chloroflexota bacterium]